MKSTKVGKDKYSKTYRFTDINYAVASREDKEAMFLESVSYTHLKSEDKIGQIMDYGKRVIRCKCSLCHSKCQRTDNDHCAISTDVGALLMHAKAEKTGYVDDWEMRCEHHRL